MLARNYRLPATHRLVSARTHSTPLFLVKASPNGLPYSRFGFVITKRTAKSAVARNRTKRMIRARVEALFERITPGQDVLFILRKDLSEEKTDDSMETVVNSFKKLGLFRI